MLPKLNRISEQCTKLNNVHEKTELASYLLDAFRALNGLDICNSYCCIQLCILITLRLAANLFLVLATCNELMCA